MGMRQADPKVLMYEQRARRMKILDKHSERVPMKPDFSESINTDDELCPTPASAKRNKAKMSLLKVKFYL